MKWITAEEYYTLIESIACENPRGKYWEIKKVSKTIETEEVDEYELDRSSFSGYGQGSVATKVVYIEKEVDESSINLAKLLTSKGYEPAAFPICIPNVRLNKEGCSDQFFSRPFSDELLADLVWCLQNNKLESKAFENILNIISPNYLSLLYRSDISTYQKDEIYLKFPNCDPKRKLFDKIQGLFRNASADKTVTPEGLENNKNSLDELETFLASVEQGLDNADFNKYKDRLNQEREKLAQIAFSKKNYTLVVHLYTQLIEINNDQDLINNYCLNRAIAYYYQNNYDNASSDFKYYSKHEKEKYYEFWIYRGLTRIAQEDYTKASINFCNIRLNQNQEIVQKSRKIILDHLSVDQLVKLCDKLLKLVQKSSSKNEKLFYKKEYIAYIQLAAQCNHSFAQYRLYHMMRESDPFIAEMWLGRSAAQGNELAQHHLAQIYKDQSTPELHEHNYSQIRSLIKQSAQSDYKPSKNIMHDYYQKIADSFKAKVSISTSVQKRKAFLDAVDKHKPVLGEPPIKIPKIQSSAMDLFLNSKKPGKRVRIPDTTHQMAPHVEEAYSKDKDKKKRNYLAANLTLIFSDAAEPQKRTKRYVRTISIDVMKKGQHVNIEDLHPANNEEESNKVQKTLNDKHKNAIAKANVIYHNLKRQKLEEIKLLDFIPKTADKSHNPHKYKDTEYVLYDYLCNSKFLERIVDYFIMQNKDVFLPGCKVYGVVLDIYSVYASCTDCKKISLVLQNSPSFLNALQNILNTKNYKCLTRAHPGLWDQSKLYFQIRIRAGKELKKKNDPYADIDILPKQNDLKLLNNSLFFHKIEKPVDNPVPADKDYLIFESGTHADRSHVLAK